MKFLKLTITVLPLLFLLNCSSSKEIQVGSDEESSPPILLKSANLEITIPSGWREIKDNHEQLFEIWLINNSKTSMIGFIPITLSSDLEQINISNKLDLIEKIIIQDKKVSDKEIEILNQEIVESKFPAKQIRFLVDGEIQNSIIFGMNENFFESIALYYKNYSPSESEVEQLVATQRMIIKNSILK